MPRITKEIILLATTAICIGIGLWSGKNLLMNSATDLTRDYRSLLLPLSMIILGGAFFILSTIFIKNNWLAYGGVLLIFGLPYLTIGLTKITVGFISATILILAWVIFHMRRTAVRASSFQLVPITKIGLPAYFTVASLLFTAFYMTGLSQETAFEALFPQPLMQVVFSALGNNIGSFVGMPSLHVNPNDTVDRTIEAIISQQAQGQGITLNTLSPTLRTQALAEERRALSTQLGVPLQGNQKIGDLFNRIIHDRIVGILGQYQSYLPLVVAITFFLTLKTISIPLYYLALLAAFLLIKLLLALTILKREVQQIPAERIVLS